MIRSLREEMREGFATVNRRLDTRVSRELYETEKRGMIERVSGIESGLAAEKQHLTNTRRFMIGMIVTIAIALLPLFGISASTEG